MYITVLPVKTFLVSPSCVYNLPRVNEAKGEGEGEGVSQTPFEQWL